MARAIGVVLVGLLVSAACADQGARSGDGQASERSAQASVQDSLPRSAAQRGKGPPPVPFTVISTDDLSRKAMGNRSLSDFTTSELERLPTNKKIRVRAFVADTIREAQVQPTVQAIVDDLTAQDPDLDEIALFLYSSEDRARAGGLFDVARATWSTYGELGGITPTIARENVRSEYSLSVDVKSNLETYLADANKDETREGLSEARRKKIYRALVRAEDRATNEAQRQFPVMCVMPSTYEANMERNRELEDRLMAEYTAQVRQEHGITEATVDSIKVEAMRENWPMPDPAPTPHCD